MSVQHRWWRDEQGAIPFVLIGLVALGGTLGLAWAGNEWAQTLLGEAGGELTVWVLRGAFWSLDLVALQASSTPVDVDWYTPVLTGPALPILTLAAITTVAALVAEVIAAMAQGNTTRIVQAVFRGLMAGMLATVGAALLLAIGGALSEVGRAALAASGTTVDAPLLPLQEVLMEAAQDRDGGGAELFVAFLAAVVIVLTSVSIYFVLAMRPVLLAAIIVFLPVAHALSVWTPLRRVQARVWSLAFAVLLADAAILTMFAVAGTAMGQPQGVDRLIFGTFGLLLAALSPAALARIVGAPELHTAVQAMSRGSKMLAAGAAVAGYKAAAGSASRAIAASQRGGDGGGGSALEAAGPGDASPGGDPAGGGPGGSGGSGYAVALEEPRPPDSTGGGGAVRAGSPGGSSLSTRASRSVAHTAGQSSASPPATTNAVAPMSSATATSGWSSALTATRVEDADV